MELVPAGHWVGETVELLWKAVLVRVDDDGSRQAAYL
jgi:hypothetical protein